MLLRILHQKETVLAAYEPRIRRYNERFVSQMLRLAAQPVNVSHWFNYYGFGAMGDLAFDKDFAMLADGEFHWAVIFSLSFVNILK